MDNKAVYSVLNYGKLYEGENITEEQKWTNTETVQTALDTVGKNGGGTVLIPEGIYCLNGHQESGDVPGYPENTDTACLYICYSNVTLSGSGMNKTFIRTPGEYKIVKNRNGEDTVQRVHGIRIMPLKGSKELLTNITFRDFDLYGGTHSTGKTHWPSDIETGDGWDIMHKGICFHDTDGVRLGKVGMYSICVHGYRGEITYAGGAVQKIDMNDCKMFDTNGSCFNFGAHFATVENSRFGSDEYGSNMWVEFANYNRFLELGNGSCTFKNCYFTGNRSNAFSFNEGHNDGYSIFIENNVMNLGGSVTCNGVGCFMFDGGTSGPVNIKNNTIISRDGAISVFNSDCWEGRHRHKDENFIIENNLIKGFRAMLTFVSAYGAPNPERMFNNRFEKQHKNMVIRNNIFESLNDERARPSVMLGNDKETMSDYLDGRWHSKCLPYFENIRFENNIFINAVMPWLRDHYGSAPAFKNNRYENCRPKKNDGVGYGSVQEITKEHARVVPVIEFLELTAKEPIFARLRAHNPMDLRAPAYEEGYTVTLSGQKGTAAITFKPDDTNTFENEVVLTEDNRIRIRYNRKIEKWELLEVINGELRYEGEGADISKHIGADLSCHIGALDTVIDIK